MKKTLITIVGIAAIVYCMTHGQKDAAEAVGGLIFAAFIWIEDD